jgi:hypothetical protein
MNILLSIYTTYVLLCYYFFIFNMNYLMFFSVYQQFSSALVCVKSAT